VIDMPRHRHSERERSDKRLRRPYILLITEQFLQAFHNVAMERLRYLRRIHEKIERERRKAIRERAEQLLESLKQRQLTVYAVFSDDSLKSANIDKNLIEQYGVDLDELILSLAEYSTNAFLGVPPTEKDPDRIKAVGRYYYAPFNPSEIHTTACAIRITPKTARVLHGLKADFYVIAINTPEGLTSMIIERSNPVYHLV